MQRLQDLHERLTVLDKLDQARRRRQRDDVVGPELKVASSRFRVVGEKTGREPEHLRHHRVLPDVVSSLELRESQGVT